MRKKFDRTNLSVALKNVRWYRCKLLLAPMYILKRVISHSTECYTTLNYVGMRAVDARHRVSRMLQNKNKARVYSREMLLYRVTSVILPQSTRSKIFFLTETDNSTVIANNRVFLTTARLVHDAISFAPIGLSIIAILDRYKLYRSFIADHS